MEVKTYRAATMHEALDAGAARPGARRRRAAHARSAAAAAVRAVARAAADRGHGLGRGERAQPPAAEPAALGEPRPAGPSRSPSTRRRPAPPTPAAATADVSDEVQGQLTDLQSMVEDLCRQSRGDRPRRSARGAVPPVHRPDRRRPERRAGPRTGRAGSRARRPTPNWPTRCW